MRVHRQWNLDSARKRSCNLSPSRGNPLNRQLSTVSVKTTVETVGAMHVQTVPIAVTGAVSYSFNIPIEVVAPNWSDLHRAEKILAACVQRWQ